MSNLTRKGYARIYCEHERDMPKIVSIIKDIDAFEYDYLPGDLIAPFSEYPKLVYTHKFCDLDMDILVATCWSKGIKIWVLDNGHSEIVNDAVK